MKKNLLASAVLLAFTANAFAANEFADGKEVVLNNYSGNFYAGQYYVSGGNPTNFNPTNSYYFRSEGNPSDVPNTKLDTKVTLTGTLADGDLVGGNVFRGVDCPIDSEHTDLSLNSTTVIVDGGIVEENLIGGTKFTNYKKDGLKSDIGTVNIIVKNGGVVKEATIVGSVSKSSGQTNSTVSNANVTVEGGSTLNGLIIGGVSAETGGNSTKDYGLVSSVKVANVTIKDSTVNAIGEKGTHSIKTAELDGVAILHGGVAYDGGNAGAAGNRQSDTGTVVVNLSGAEVNGDVYLGGLAADNKSKVNVESSTVVLGKGTKIDGELNMGHLNGENGQSNELSATATFDSTDVVITGGVKTTESAVIQATGNFNDENASAEDALAKLQKITGLSGEKAHELTIQEGMYNGAIATNANGTVVAKVNSIMSNVLDLTASTTLSMNRILMNDVRKRLGDIRSAEGTHGIWARYDGGKFSGSNGFENDFHTI
ncbi:MAG: hypothetical protein IJ022_05930, partial [Burkholderiaceae bacterium]|nr:hypothetical protein [Burkholderiaceae bacterium]